MSMTILLSFGFIDDRVVWAGRVVTKLIMNLVLREWELLRGVDQSVDFLRHMNQDKKEDR